MEPTLSLSSAPELYRPRRPERSPFYAVLYQFFDRFTREYEQRFERTFGPLRGIVPKTVERAQHLIMQPRCRSLSVEGNSCREMASNYAIFMSNARD